LVKVSISRYLDELGLSKVKPFVLISVGKCDCGEFADYVRLSYWFDGGFKLHTSISYFCLDCLNKNNLVCE